MEEFQYMHVVKNKRIGRVLYLVEGDVDEVVLLEHIFNCLLGYHTVSYDKRIDEVKCLEADNDPYSKVFIVPMKYSAVSKILTSGDYLNYIYKTLKKYGLEKDECAKYLIFDRDRESNSLDKYYELISIFKNSLDNDLEINGLLLISYPCMQALYCECFGEEKDFSSSEKLKKYSNRFKLKNLKEENLICGASHLLSCVNKITSRSQFDVNNLDDMENINKTVLSFEEKYYQKKRAFFALSMILFSLIDLGIIELED